MRRFRFPLLILVTLTIMLLFLGDFLTGRVHFEFENPYNRTRKIVERKFGFPRESLVENPGMSEIYHSVLKQPKAERWEPSGVSYRVEKFTGRQIIEKTPVPPVMFLPPERELEFLRALPNNAARRAVIESLFQPRKIGMGPEIAAHNDRLAQLETERVRTICGWYDFDRQNFTESPRQWWERHAARFGIKPDGTPLAPAGGNSPADKGEKQEQVARKQP